MKRKKALDPYRRLPHYLALNEFMFAAKFCLQDGHVLAAKYWLESAGSISVEILILRLNETHT